MPWWTILLYNIKSEAKPSAISFLTMLLELLVQAAVLVFAHKVMQDNVGGHTKYFTKLESHAAFT